MKRIFLLWLMLLIAGNVFASPVGVMRYPSGSRVSVAAMTPEGTLGVAGNLTVSGTATVGGSLSVAGTITAAGIETGGTSPNEYFTLQAIESDPMAYVTADHADGAGDLYVQNDVEIDGALYVDGSVYSAGSVGIGVVNPEAKLDVRGGGLYVGKNETFVWGADESDMIRSYWGTNYVEMGLNIYGTAFVRSNAGNKLNLSGNNQYIEIDSGVVVISTELQINDTNTGTNAGDDLCIGADNQVCRCGTCN